MRPIISLLLRLYPATWRARYGDEFEALLEERILGLRADYDPARTPVSLLLLGASGPLMAAGFVVAGLLILWFATVAPAEIRGDPSSRWGWRAIGMAGLGLVVAGSSRRIRHSATRPGRPAESAPRCLRRRSSMWAARRCCRSGSLLA